MATKGIAANVGRQKDVSTTTTDVDGMQGDLTLCASLMGGTDTMRKASVTYLPKWSAEEDAAYTLRLSTAVLFPAFKRTVKTLAAKPLSKPIAVSEGVPERIKEWLKDVDMQGRDLHAFVSTVMEEALGAGICGVLVDYSKADTVQRTETGATTQAAEQAAGLRPSLVVV